MYTGSSCPISSATLGFPGFKSCIILVGMCSGISLWFKVHFHDVWSRAPLHMLTSHVATLFPKVSLQAVCPFGYWVVVSLLIYKRISKFKTGGAGCKESQKEMLQGQPGTGVTQACVHIQPNWWPPDTVEHISFLSLSFHIIKMGFLSRVLISEWDDEDRVPGRETYHRFLVLEPLRIQHISIRMWIWNLNMWPSIHEACDGFNA